MEIKEIQHGHFTTLTPIGDLDANSSMVMDGKIQEVIDSGCFNVHVDCSGLRYISSAGLGVFISFMDELASNGGKFVFSNLSEHIHNVFKLLGLEQLMEIVLDANEAEKRFEP